MNGIEIGYRNSSPLEAFTLAIIMQITFRNTRKTTIGMPTMMTQRGIVRTMYSSIERLKLSDAFPFLSTHSDSSFLVNQQIRGPMIPPNGKKNPAKAERWHNIAQFLSVSDNSMISFMTNRFLLKDVYLFLVMHYQNLARRFKSAGNNPFGLVLSITCWL